MIDRNRKFCFAMVASATFGLAGCGAARQEQGSARSGPNTQAPGGTLAPKAATARAAEIRLPSEAQIKSAQKVTIKPTPAPESDTGRLRSARELDAEPGRATAPANVLELASRAAKEWLSYRINGDTPSASVIPRSVWDGVPPAAPSLRMQGGALITDLHAFSAHPENEGWIVSVSTPDPRLSTVVVDVRGPARAARVRGITG